MPTCMYPEHHGPGGGDSPLLAVIIAAVAGVAGLAVAAIAAWHFAAAHALVLILGAAGITVLIAGGVWLLHRYATVACWTPEADRIVEAGRRALEQRSGIAPEPEPAPDPVPAEVPEPEPIWPAVPFLKLVRGGNDAA
jgi:hypothetical protein